MGQWTVELNNLSVNHHGIDSDQIYVVQVSEAAILSLACRWSKSRTQDQTPGNSIDQFTSTVQSSGS